MRMDLAVPEAVALPLDQRRLRAVGEGVAKRWVLFLLAGRSLQQATALPLANLVAFGPRLGQRLLLAIGDEEAVPSLLEAVSSGELGLGVLSGARGPEELLRAGEALRAATWQELSSLAEEGVVEASPRLANRLAYITTLVVAAALRGVAAESAAEQERKAGEPPEPEPAGREPPQWRRAAVTIEQTLGSAAAHPAVLPVAVLLLEVEGVERLRSSESEEALAALLERVGSIMAGELRPDDQIAQEGEGRWWLVAPNTDQDGARALAARLVDAVRDAVAHRGTPLRLTCGLAVATAAPDPRRLAAEAERSLFAARAAGVPLPPR